MKPAALILIVLSLIKVQAFSQEKTNYKDSIEISENFWTGITFYQDNKKLSNRDMYTRMKTNPEAFSFYNKARTNNTLGFIIGFAGGFMIGYELGGLISGKDIQWGIMGAGMGLVGISIPFSSAAMRNFRKAVFSYNAIFR
jgi:hypothetical protein